MISTQSGSRRRRAGIVAFATIAVAAVVGASTASSASSPEYGDTTPTTAAAMGSAAAETGAAALPVGGSSVGVAESPVGPILVDPNGMTLYMFANDTEGESVCAGECLANWPVAAVDGEPDVGDLDESLFSTVASTEGDTMLKVGDWPLYLFAGDAAPGDMNGQGVGGVWWVVTPNGNPIAHASVVETELGPTVVDGQGLTLYAFSNDTEGESTCFDDCATNWPPALVGDGDGGGGSTPPGTESAATEPVASEPAATSSQLFVGDLDPALFSIVEHPQGPMLKIGDWPLYRFAGDAAPGDVNGQAVGDVWWAVSPDGTLIEG